MLAAFLALFARSAVFISDFGAALARWMVGAMRLEARVAALFAARRGGSSNFFGIPGTCSRKLSLTEQRFGRDFHQGTGLASEGTSGKTRDRRELGEIASNFSERVAGPETRGYIYSP